MPHNKVFGHCENLCNVEVPSKAETDQLYNENILLGGDFLTSAAGFKLGECWNVSNFISTAAIGLMLQPIGLIGSIEQEIASVWVGPVDTDFFPITVCVEFIKKYTSSDPNVESVTMTFDTMPTIDVINRVCEIESGVYLNLIFGSSALGRTIKFKTSAAVTNAPFVIRRIKVEHGTRFTGWGSSIKDSIIINKINHDKYYHVGDEISLYKTIAAGYITSNATVMDCFIPMPKKPSNDVEKIVISGSIYYRVESTMVTMDLSDFDSIEVSANDLGLTIRVTKSSGFSVATNSNVTVWFKNDAKIEFCYDDAEDDEDVTTYNEEDADNE